MLVWLAVPGSPRVSRETSKFDCPRPLHFLDLVPVWNAICSQVSSAPAWLSRAHPRTIRWLCCPFPPAEPGLCLRPPLQSGFRRREEARFRPCCPHVLSRPSPPALRRGSQACSSSRLLLRQPPQLPALPVPAQRPPLHSHFLSPALEPWRPGQARPLRPRGARQPQSCPGPWAQEAAATTARDIQAFHPPPRPPPI